MLLEEVVDAEKGINSKKASIIHSFKLGNYVHEIPYVRCNGVLQRGTDAMVTKAIHCNSIGVHNLFISNLAVHLVARTTAHLYSMLSPIISHTVHFMNV